MPTGATGKLSGQRSVFTFLAPGASGQQVTLKSITAWDIDITVKEIDASDHDSQGWEDKLEGLASWKATIKGLYFEGDATQQAILGALVAGLSGNGNVGCSFYPQKGTVGDGTLVYTGTGVVTSYKHSTAQSAAESYDLTISGRGPLVNAAQ